MKAKIIFVLLLTSLSTFSFGQTYSFSKVVEKATVQTSSGKQQKVIGTYQGQYRFIFEKPNDPQIKRLFTILRPGQNNGPGLPYFALVKEMEYVEKDGKLLKKSLYFNTESNEKEIVLIAADYSLIVIFKSDNTIWEYVK